MPCLLIHVAKIKTAMKTHSAKLQDLRDGVMRGEEQENLEPAMKKRKINKKYLVGLFISNIRAPPIEMSENFLQKYFYVTTSRTSVYMLQMGNNFQCRFSRFSNK